MALNNLLYGDITETIIEAFYEVYNTIGYGFLEKVDENALVHELTLKGLHVKQQYPIAVYYKDVQVGQYFADIFVEQCVIIENKCADVIANEHSFQLINYLKATGVEVGIILNFGKKPEFRRKVFTDVKG